jgi:hypothetical protein
LWQYFSRLLYRAPFVGGRKGAIIRFMDPSQPAPASSAAELAAAVLAGEGHAPRCIAD